MHTRHTVGGIVAQHEERMATLQQTLDAIKDLLDRGNEHEEDAVCASGPVTAG
jgi:hypothetical protein